MNRVKCAGAPRVLRGVHRPGVLALPLSMSETEIYLFISGDFGPLGPRSSERLRVRETRSGVI